MAYEVLAHRFSSLSALTLAKSYQAETVRTLPKHIVAKHYREPTFTITAQLMAY